MPVSHVYSMMLAFSFQPFPVRGAEIEFSEFEHSKWGMAAVPRRSAKILFPFQQNDLLDPGFSQCKGRGNTGGPSSDDDNISRV